MSQAFGKKWIYFARSGDEILQLKRFSLPFPREAWSNGDLTISIQTAARYRACRRLIRCRQKKLLTCEGRGGEHVSVVGFTEADRLRESVVTRRTIGRTRVKWPDSTLPSESIRVEGAANLSVSRDFDQPRPMKFSFLSSLETFFSFVHSKNLAFIAIFFFFLTKDKFYTEQLFERNLN